MRFSEASRTMLRTAALRASHQLLDDPPIFQDPIALQFVSATSLQDAAASMGEDAIALRTLVALRSRFAENQLAQAATRDVSELR